MSGATRPCPGCGSPVDPGTKFCGQCGHDVRAEPAPAEPQAPAPQPAATQPAATEQPASQPAPEVPAPEKPAPAAKGGDKRTMLGMPAVKMQRPDAAPEPTEPPSQPATQQPADQHPAPAPEQASRRPQRTMLGMAAPVVKPPADGGVSAPEQPAEPPPAQPDTAVPQAGAGGRAPSPNTHRTMLGMTAPSVDAARAQAEQLEQQAAQGEPQQTPQTAGAGDHVGAPEKHIPATSNRTMLGMSAPQPGAVEAPGTTRRSSAPPAPPAYGTRGRAAVRYGSDFDLTEDDYSPTKPKGRAGLFVGLGLGCLLLLAVAGVGGYLALSGGPDVRASVEQGQAGEELRVEVPGAAPGTKVRFGGTEAPLEGGVATFPLAPGALHVGDNELNLEVVEPDGDAAQATVTLEVRYRVRPDLTALQRDPPALAIQVDAMTGSEVTLDGEAVQLDADGHATVELPLPETTGEGDAYTREVSYRIRLPEGPPADGVVSVRVPYAQMQLDRPGTNVTTDSESIEIAGAVHPEATVTVDGEAIDVNDEGRFVHTYPLPEPGTYEPRVVGRRPGRAPRSITPTIRRVEDMEAEAASFEADQGVTYARIQQNPAIYRGQKLAVEGRVYNVNVEGGRSDIQILVRDCPRGQRCPLWVSYPAATEATANDWVRVLGTVGGEQQFRSESNRVITVPRVDAQFVLPLDG